jgi:hypothetical protein
MGQLRVDGKLLSAVWLASSRRNQFECQEDEERETHINHDKYPFRDFIEENLVQPALDETLLNGSFPQGVFKPRERTDHANKGLTGDKQDGSKMGKPKSAIPHKTEVHPFAYPDQRQTADDKQHEKKVNDQDEIS